MNNKAAFNSPKIHDDIKKCAAFAFDRGIYIFVCLFHFFSFLILGPLVNLYTLFSGCTGAPYLCRNFLFSRMFFQFYTQNYMWVAILLYYYCTFFTDGDVGDSGGIILAVVMFFTRASVIAVKYAVSGQQNWNRVKTEEIPT